MDADRAKNEVIKAGHQLVELGLAARTWGNISCRIDENTFAITPSGISYERLTRDKIAVVEFDSKEYEGNIMPSSEKGIHEVAYKLDSEINFVIHTHQTYATCISISGFNKLKPTDDELTEIGGSIGLASYGISGTKKITENVKSEMAKGRRAVLLANHGAVLAGSNRKQTFKTSVMLEEMCRRTMLDLPDFNDNTSEGGDNIRSIIRNTCPKFTSIMLLDSENINRTMGIVDTLPAVLDDFAQIVGLSIKTSNTENVVKKLRGRNAVYVKDLGVLCCAENDLDCKAMITLTEKNALAYLNAVQNGDSPGISYFEKKLMRHTYLKKYSIRNKTYC